MIAFFSPVSVPLLFLIARYTRDYCGDTGENPEKRIFSIPDALTLAVARPLIWGCSSDGENGFSNKGSRGFCCGSLAGSYIAISICPESLFLWRGRFFRLDGFRRYQLLRCCFNTGISIIAPHFLHRAFFPANSCSLSTLFRSFCIAH